MLKPHSASNGRADSTKALCRGLTLILPESRRKILTCGLIQTAALVLTAAPVVGFAADADQAPAAQQSASSQQAGAPQQSTTTQDQQSGEAAQPISTQQLSEITISAAEVHSLSQFTPTGSRLGLTLQELPATLSVISSDEMLGRGFASVEDAADSQAGVTSGGTPGDLEEFSTRGFTGDEIT
ncbi:MAG: TonB-dependent receptor plug domain-containing protein, partial [Acetobacteraceae bacterium]